LLSNSPSVKEAEDNTLFFSSECILSTMKYSGIWAFSWFEKKELNLS